MFIWPLIGFSCLVPQMIFCCFRPCNGLSAHLPWINPLMGDHFFDHISLKSWPTLIKLVPLISLSKIVLQDSFWERYGHIIIWWSCVRKVLYACIHAGYSSMSLSLSCYVFHEMMSPMSSNKSIIKVTFFRMPYCYLREKNNYMSIFFFKVIIFLWCPKWTWSVIYWFDSKEMYCSNCMFAGNNTFG